MLIMALRFSEVPRCLEGLREARPHFSRVRGLTQCRPEYLHTSCRFVHSPQRPAEAKEERGFPPRPIDGLLGNLDQQWPVQVWGQFPGAGCCIEVAGP
jgi:hypothetical protein